MSHELERSRWNRHNKQMTFYDNCFSLIFVVSENKERNNVMSTISLLKRADRVLIEEEYKERILWLKYLKSFNLQVVFSMVEDFEGWVRDKISLDYISYI